MSLENRSVALSKCPRCCCADAYSLISSTCKRCVILCLDCLLHFISYPYPVLFKTLDNGFNARQTQSGLNESPWYMTRSMFIGCVVMVLFCTLKLFSTLSLRGTESLL
jgi:hypothetical protein